MSKSLSLNVLAMLLAKFLPAAFAFAINIAVARVAGVETLGAYANLLALQIMFQALTSAGLHLFVAREVAASPRQASAHAQQAMMTGVLTGVVGTFTFVLYALLALPEIQVLPALVLASTVLPSAWIAVQEGIFIGTRKHHLVAVVAMLENAVKLTAAGAALAGGYGLLGVSVAIASSRLIAVLLGAHLVRRLGITTTARVRPAVVMTFARELAPFAALSVIAMIYFRIGVPIVQVIAGETGTGLLAAAVTLYGALLLLPDSVLFGRIPAVVRGVHSIARWLYHRDVVGGQRINRLARRDRDGADGGLGLSGDGYLRCCVRRRRPFPPPLRRGSAYSRLQRGVRSGAANQWSATRHGQRRRGRSGGAHCADDPVGACLRCRRRSGRDDRVVDGRCARRPARVSSARGAGPPLDERRFSTAGGSRSAFVRQRCAVRDATGRDRCRSVRSRSRRAVARPLPA